MIQHLHIILLLFFLINFIIWFFNDLVDPKGAACFSRITPAKQLFFNKVRNADICFFEKNETSISTYASSLLTTERSMNIIGLSGRINGVKLSRIITGWDFRM